MGVNIASHAHLPSCPRTEPLVWTPDRVRHWQVDGVVPGEVMVWTPQQAITFLTHARKYPWSFPMLHLIAVEGLRQGEAVDLPWANSRLGDGEAGVRIQVDHAGLEDADDHSQVTRWFTRVVRAAGLPPIHLHGLRHGAASLAPAAGADVKVVSGELGHATTYFTHDTYQTVFPEVARAAAEATAAMLKPVSR